MGIYQEREWEMGIYQETKVVNDLEVSGLYSFHYFEFVRNFQGKRETHDFPELVYIDYGRVKILSDEKEHCVSAGEGFLHAANENHGILSTDEYASAFIISFACTCRELACIQSRVLQLDGRGSMLMKLLYENGQKVFGGPYDLFDQSSLTFREPGPYGGVQVVKNLLELLLLHLIAGRLQEETLAGQEAPDKANERILVRRVREILQEQLYSQTSLDCICGQLSYSKSYVLRTFKKHTGSSVMECYNQMKIKEAKRLISEGRYTCTEIAQLLHYSSVHHFSRAFKQFTNMTPSGYQKSVQNRYVI